MTQDMVVDFDLDQGKKICT